MTHSTKPENLIGLRFGRLVVLKKLKNKNTKRNWLCLCDCGKEHSVAGYLLKRGSTQSCGCLRIESLSLPGDESSFNTFYSVYESNAKKSNRVFDLSKDEFRNITSLPCSYCGAEPTALGSRGRVNKVITYVCNGIDRLDNSTGYTKDNCAPCCTLCNLMKRSLTVDEFKKQIEKIHSYSEDANHE